MNDSTHTVTLENLTICISNSYILRILRYYPDKKNVYILIKNISWKTILHLTATTDANAKKKQQKWAMITLYKANNSSKWNWCGYTYIM